MTVYIVQEVKGRNVLSAEKYGDLELLLPEGSQIVLSAGPTVRRLTHRLRNFNDDDYLLLIGDPAAIGMATVIAAEYNRGKIQFLKWDRQEKQYYPIKFDIHQKGEM